MAAATETIFWPLVAGLGLAFIILTVIMLSQAERDVQFHTSQQIAHTSARSTIMTFLNTENGEGKLNYKAIALCYGGIDNGYDREAINNPPGVLRFTMALATRKGAPASPEETGNCPTGDSDYGSWTDSTTLTKGDPPTPWIAGGQHTGSRSGSGVTGGVRVFRTYVPKGGNEIKPVEFRYEADKGAY
jgi:hypothetical protein